MLNSNITLTLVIFSVFIALNVASKNKYLIQLTGSKNLVIIFYLLFPIITYIILNQVNNVESFGVDFTDSGLPPDPALADFPPNSYLSNISEIAGGMKTSFCEPINSQKYPEHINRCAKHDNFDACLSEQGDIDDGAGGTTTGSICRFFNQSEESNFTVDNEGMITSTQGGVQFGNKIVTGLNHCDASNFPSEHPSIETGTRDPRLIDSTDPLSRVQPYRLKRATAKNWFTNNYVPYITWLVDVFDNMIIETTVPTIPGFYSQDTATIESENFRAGGSSAYFNTKSQDTTVSNNDEVRDGFDPPDVVHPYSTALVDINTAATTLLNELKSTIAATGGTINDDGSIAVNSDGSIIIDTNFILLYIEDQVDPPLTDSVTGLKILENSENILDLFDECIYMLKKYLNLNPKSKFGDKPWKIRGDYYGLFPFIQVDLIDPNYKITNLLRIEQKCDQFKNCSYDEVSRKCVYNSGDSTRLVKSDDDNYSGSTTKRDYGQIFKENQTFTNLNSIYKLIKPYIFDINENPSGKTFEELLEERNNVLLDALPGAPGTYAPKFTIGTTLTPLLDEYLAITGSSQVDILDSANQEGVTGDYHTRSDRTITTGTFVGTQFGGPAAAAAAAAAADNTGNR